MSEHFGEVIKKHRLAKDLSLRDLGNLVHVSFSYISKLEKGGSIPSRRVVTRLAQALCVPEAELLEAAGYLPVEPVKQDNSVVMRKVPEPKVIDRGKFPFGAILKRLRLENDLTQDQLADAIDVGQPEISQYENGIASPDGLVLVKIADYFKCSTDYLLGRTEEPSEPEGSSDEIIAAHYEGMKGEDLSDLQDIIDDAVKRAAAWRAKLDREGK